MENHVRDFSPLIHVQTLGDIDTNDDDIIGRDELKSPWSVPTPTIP